MAIFQNYYRTRDLGLLIVRVGIGCLFTLHGYPKLVGGPEKWLELGGVMKLLGVQFAPMFWGLLAAVAEAVGGQLLALGLFFRLTCGLLLATMAVAATMHVRTGEGFAGSAHALESAVLFLGLAFLGPGRYSLDEVLFPAKRRLY